MSKAIDSLVYELTKEIERRLNAQKALSERTNQLAQARQDIAKLAERVAELEAMPLAYEKAELVEAKWVGEGVDDEPEWEDAYEYEHPYEGDAYDGHLTFTRF